LVIDCHTQIGSGTSWTAPKKPVDYRVELLLEQAAEAGIDCSCVMAPQNDSYEQANIEVARICEKHPGKLIGFAMHSPQRETGRLRAMLTEEVKSMGLKGLKTDGHPTREILDVVTELGIPVIYYPTPDHCPDLYRMYYLMARTYPSVNFILPHIGSYASSSWSAHLVAIDLAKRLPNVYLETSGLLGQVLEGRGYIEIAAQDLPAKKILFGSFAPELDQRVEMYAVKVLKLPVEQESKILGGNMQGLLQLRT
jgi:uncharacterized protein